jgi:membrane associated rhomboid family serine protease
MASLRRVPLATYALLGACVSVYAGMVTEGAGLLLVEPDHLVAAGAVDASRVWRGEVWRLFSALFVHAAVWHVGLNMWVFWQVGRVLERVLGTPRFTLVYLISGLSGFAASLLIHGGISAGASGAIFGVAGGLLALAAVTRETPFGKYLLRALGPFIGATLLIGFLLPFVDNAAHVGGLVMGFLLSYGLLADEKGARLEALLETGILDETEVVALRPRFASAALVVSLLIFAALVPTALRPWFSPRYHVVTGFAALRTGEPDQARERLDKARSLAAEDPGVLLLAGRVAHADGELDKAQEFFSEAVDQLDEDPDVAMIVALREAGLSGVDQAIAVDAPLAAGICDSQLRREGASTTALLVNNCAWILLKVEDPSVHDPARALQLAQQAVRMQEAKERDAAYAAMLHTLAEAWAQNGRPKEARALMERIAAEGLSDDPMFEAERARFDELAKKAAAG